MGKKVDYKRTMLLGKWLGCFLSPSLSSWNIGDITDEALRLQNIDHVRMSDDPLITIVSEVLQNHNVAKYSVDRDELDGDLWLDLLEIARKIFLATSPVFASEPFIVDSESRFIAESALRTLKTRKIILFLIRILQERKGVPWEHALMPDPQKARPKYSIEDLTSMYNSINDTMITTDSKVLFVRRMTTMSTGGESNVDLPSLLAYMFIDFLREGGRDYCGLCSHCGKFILAERKGQRLYCSGACRVAHKRKKDSQNF